MATKAELEAALAARDAEPPTVSLVLAVPVITAGSLLTVAVLYLAAQRMPGGAFRPEYLGAVAFVAWALGHVVAESRFSSEFYGYGVATGARTFVFGTGVAGTLWLVWTGRVGPAVTWPALVLGAGVMLLGWATLLWTAARRDSPPVAVTGDADHVMPWAQLLQRATGGRVVLVAVDYHRAGARLTVEPARVTDDDGMTYDDDVTFDDFAGCAPRFASLASREYRRRGTGRLPLNCARPEEGRDDAEFLLHVTMRDVFTADSAYVPAAGPQDIATPRDLGEYEDATRILVTLLSGHSKIVGCTGAGKSVEANNWIARITECANALVWVCATDKLIPLVFPWLRSWFAGTAPRPCLDYVAGLHIDQVLGMLADAYALCCARNARLTDESKMTATAQEPAVFVVVEEMSHAMEFTTTIVTHDGITCDLSTLIMMVARAGRSANVRLVLMSQTALNSASGDCAAEIIRNLQIRVCLRTMESHDGYRTIPALSNVDTTTIPLHTKIVQPSTENARAMPGKAPMLDGTATIDPLAVRNAAWRPVGVEPESGLGPRYRDRWDPRRHPELARAVAKHHLSWRIPTEGGGVTEQWTDADQAAAWEAADPPGQSRAFRLPDGTRELNRLRALAADLTAHPPRLDPEEPGEEPAPLPPPLDAILAWLDEQDEPAAFYLTETIAAAIGHSDTTRLGRLIWRTAHIHSRLALAEEDPEGAARGQRRRGYETAGLREAATRIRFGL